MKRRDFVKTGIVASSGVFFIDSFLGCINPDIEKDQLGKYFEEFQNPPAASGVFVRWWWNGNMLNKKEILRELDVMKANGISGVEINPIAFPDIDDPADYGKLTKNHKILPVFGDEWLEMVKIALQGVKERGMICDMLVGSGWPFGGEFLHKEDQIQMATIETIDLEGEKTYDFKLDELLDKVDIHNYYKNKPIFKKLLLVRLVPKTPGEFVEGKDLTNNFSNKTITINVPKGKYVLYYVVKVVGYMRVIRGVPGAAGPVLNHYSKLSVENYLNKVSSLLTSKIGDMGKYIRAMFCDSMELEGANWNDDVPDEFEKRRGYSLLPYLPFILKKKGTYLSWIKGIHIDEYGTEFPEKVKELLKRVDLDFHNTLIELLDERFVDTFNTWCHQNAVQSRVQAYGPGYSLLESSMKIDIPEAEVWIRKEVGTEFPDVGQTGRSYSVINKYVSSAAALAGKNIVSCEEMTNTSVVFMTSLEKVKITGDQGIISGIKQSVLHGFNYSPSDIPFPGWVRYGTFFSERNTWWPYFKLWSDYNARISYLLQNAVIQANVAILRSNVDVALKLGGEYIFSVEASHTDYLNNLWEAIQQNGGGCDYISENIINAASYNNGRMIYNKRYYEMLIIPEIETLYPETVQSLSAFAKTGGIIIFVGNIPFKSPCYKDSKINDDKVKKNINDLMNLPKGRVILYPSPKGNLKEWYGRIQNEMGIKPYVRFENPHDFLNQVCYRLGDSMMFFIANTSLTDHISVKADFQVEDNFYAWIWDPETGKKWFYPGTEKNNRLQLELPRATSLLIIFEKKAKGEHYPSIKFKSKGKEITGPWQLHFNHINGNQQQKEIESLTDLVDDELTRNFAGTVVYKKTLTLSQSDYHYIDLGNVRGITELSLNHQHLGTRWYGPHIYNISGVIRTGENKLEIKLITITGNYIKSLTENPVAQLFTKNQLYHSMGILGPVRIIRDISKTSD